MSNHIHIYIDQPSAVKTHDAGFKESDHPRGKGGKFATSGASGGTAEHHLAQATKHETAANTKGHTHTDYVAHVRAAAAHKEAAGHLGSAQNASQSGAGYAKGVPDKLTQAQSAAEAAAGHEAKVKVKPGTWEPKKKPTSYAALKDHPNYNADDLAELKGSGYKPEEIATMWDKETQAQSAAEAAGGHEAKIGASGKGSVGDPAFHKANMTAASAKNTAHYEKHLKGKNQTTNSPMALVGTNLAKAAESHTKAHSAAARGNGKAAAAHHAAALEYEAHAKKHGSN